QSHIGGGVHLALPYKIIAKINACLRERITPEPRAVKRSDSSLQPNNDALSRLNGLLQGSGNSGLRLRGSMNVLNMKDPDAGAGVLWQRRQFSVIRQYGVSWKIN